MPTRGLVQKALAGGQKCDCSASRRTVARMCGFRAPSKSFRPVACSLRRVRWTSSSVRSTVSLPCGRLCGTWFTGVGLSGAGHGDHRRTDAESYRELSDSSYVAGGARRRPACVYILMADLPAKFKADAKTFGRF